MNANKLTTHSLQRTPGGEAISRILAAALEAVEPSQAVRRHVKRQGNRLHIAGKTYDLNEVNRLFLISFGKASLPMAQSMAEVLGEHLTTGIVIPKSPPSPSPTPSRHPSFSVLPAAHPVPDQRSLQAAQQVINLLGTTTAADLVLFLISGGGSALLTAPSPGVSLEDLQTLTQALLACGATINEINCLRKHLSQVKGGGLARLAAPARMATLILSDVVGDPLDVIASGPTVPDPTTFQEALDILRKHNLEEETPASIKAYLQRGAAGEIPETPKAGDPVFDQAHHAIIGNNEQSARAALNQARAEGFNPMLLTTSLQGEARQAGRFLASILRQLALSGDPLPRPACLVAGGETTVTVRGDGQGGRNQELALSAVKELTGLADVWLISLATDGEDGPTDAAGAVVSGETWRRAVALGLDPNDFLARNDAYHFFAPLGDLLKPGPTQTNVCDLVFLFAC